MATGTRIQYEFTVRLTWDKDTFTDSVEADSNEHAYQLMMERYPNAVSIKANWFWCFISNSMVPLGLFAVLVVAYWLW